MLEPHSSPVAESMAGPLPDLRDFGFLQNPYDDRNNPVSGIKDALPLPRDDEVNENNVENIVATNDDKNGDWNRMDNNVDYELDPGPLLTSQGYYNYPEDPYNQQQEQENNDRMSTAQTQTAPYTHRRQQKNLGL